MINAISNIQPVIFIGHGSPMNALEDNSITKQWQRLGQKTTKPRAILMLSAHWYIPRLAVSSRSQNTTIHDFSGFPPQLANYAYPSKGSPEIAGLIFAHLQRHNYAVELNSDWALDHGAWSVLTHIFPDTDIPILQLSIDSRQEPLWHYELACHLEFLRTEGVLIIASGNIVHNLGTLNWQMPDLGYPWATTADKIISQLIERRAISQLANYVNLGDEVKQAIPSPEHFLPILYALGSADKSAPIRFFNQQLQYGSLSMTSFIIGD